MRPPVYDLARHSTPRWQTAPRGITMIDMLMGMMVTSMICLMIAGVMTAANAAWDHTTGVGDAAQHARISMDRIAYMVSQAGTYQVTGTAVVDGIAVVNRVLAGTSYPEVLVIWSGGQSGGMSAAGLQARLPLISELVIYAPQASDPSRLVEIVSPSNASSIDFTSAAFSSTILSIIAASQSTNVLLSDRVHLSSLPVPVGTTTTAGNVRFEVFKSPSDSALVGVVPGSAQWFNLIWSQGVVSGSSGLRQTTVRMEFQFNLRVNSPTGSLTTTMAFPFLGSASYRYVYHP